MKSAIVLIPAVAGNPQQADTCGAVTLQDHRGTQVPFLLSLFYGAGSATGRIAVPTTLLIGEKDNTAPGKDAAAPEVAKGLGNYPEPGPKAAKAISNATLVTWPELGHSPQVQDAKRFNEALLKALPAARS